MKTTYFSAPKLLLALTGTLPLIALTGAHNSAQAQQFSQQSIQQSALEEIIVTARKRQESLQSVPISVSAMTGDKAKLAGIFSATDLQRISPNMNVNSAWGETQPNFILRGISVANEYNANQASPIGVYVDENYLSNRVSHGLQFFDVERIEALRGPQGTLYGRNTTGGAINILTKKPSLQGGVSGSLMVGFGNANRREAEGVVDYTFAEGKAGLRAAVQYLKRDGLIDNKLPGALDGRSLDTKAGRLSFLFKPTDDLSILLKGYAGDNKPTAPGLYVTGKDPATGASTPNANSITGYTRDGLDFFEVEMELLDYYESDGSGFLARVDYDLNDSLTLTYLGSYDEGGQFLNGDLDGSPFNMLTHGWLADFDQTNQELRLTADLDKLSLIGGVYYGEDEVYRGRDSGFAGTLTQFIGNTQQRTSKAIFGSADLNVTDNLRISLGLRQTWDKISLDDYVSVFNEATLYQDLSFADEKESELTYKLSADYTLNPDVMVFASYAKGYRAAAYSASTISLDEIVYANPEFVDAFEVGVKSEWFDGVLRVNAALFYNDYTDQQLQQVIGVQTFLRNAGESTIQGAELEVLWRASDRITINSSLGLLDAEYDKLTLSGFELDGNDLPFAPPVTFNLGLDALLASNHYGDISLNVSANYLGEQYFSPFNDIDGNGALYQDSYWTVNSNLTLQNGNFSGSLWVKNLFEEEYFTYGIDIRALGYDYLVQGEARTFGIRLDYTY